MNQSDNLDILTVQEVMELLYIGKNTAYRLLKEGQINAFRIGNTRKIPRETINEYILKRCADK